MHPQLESALQNSIEASRYLAWYYCRPERALDILMPLHQLEMPEGADKKQYDAIMSCIMATTADCFVIKKEPVEAAQWYLKAAQYRSKGRYCPVYAGIVLRYNLSDHYQTAFDSINADNVSRSSLPVFFKLFDCLFCRWWMHPRLWCMPFMRRFYARRLHNRIMEK